MSKLIKLVALLSVALCATGMDASGQKRSKSPERGRIVEKEQAGRRSKSVVKGSADFEERVIRFLDRDFYVPQKFLEQCFLYKGEVAQKGKFKPEESTLIDETVGRRKKVGFDITRPVATNFKLHAASADDPAFLRKKTEIEEAIGLMVDVAFGQKQPQDIHDGQKLLMVAKIADLLGNIPMLERIKAVFMDRLQGKIDPFMRVRTFEGHNKPRVHGALLLPNNHVLSWDTNGKIIEWDLSEQSDAEGKMHPMRTFEMHKAWIRAVLLLPNGHMLSWDADGKIIEWDLSVQGDPVVSVRNAEPIYDALLLPNGHVLSWSQDKTLKEWDLSVQGDLVEPLRTLEWHAGTVFGALLLSNGHVLSWDADGKIIEWDLSVQGDPVVPVRTLYAESITNALLLPNGHVLSWSEDDKTLKEWDLSVQGDPVRPMRTIKGEKYNFLGALLLPNNHVLAWVGDGNLMELDINSFANLNIAELDLCYRILMTPKSLGSLKVKADSDDHKIFMSLPESIRWEFIRQNKIVVEQERKDWLDED